MSYSLKDCLRHILDEIDYLMIIAEGLNKTEFLAR